MEGARLAAHDLACRRGDRLLFAGLSFALGPGEALQVAGANGTGKSSLLRILAGLLRPFAGSIHSAGEIGLVDGALAMDEHLPLGRALGFWERVDHCADPSMPLAAMGLDRLRDVPVRFLSTGQRKRLAFARLLIAARPVWLLDEPLNGLDADAQAKIEALAALHCGGGGICVIASHQPFALAGMKRVELAEFTA